jgi:ribosomal-protein-alanine N-acetyltransferase
MSIALQTPRLVLREWRDGDHAPFAEICADPGVTEWLLPLNRAASNAWIARMQAHCARYGFCQWAVELPGEPAVIGAIGANWVPHQTAFTPAVELGWRLARPYWGVVTR